MKSLRILVMITASLALIGCGDDDGDMDAGMDSGPAAPMDQCTNAADLMVLTADGNDASEVATDCAVVTCIAELTSALFDPSQIPAAEACMDACLAASSVGNLSDGCSSCFVGASTCAVLECGITCQPDPLAQVCTDCRDANCTPTFDTCTGL